MTIAMSLGDVLEVVSIVGSVFAVVVTILVVYLLVRPSRGRRAAPPPEADALDREEMFALMDRMERRLEAVERLVAQDQEPARIAPRREHEISNAVEDREPGRTK